jgi:hypothetical protein
MIDTTEGCKENYEEVLEPIYSRGYGWCLSPWWQFIVLVVEHDEEYTIDEEHEYAMDSRDTDDVRGPNGA